MPISRGQMNRQLYRGGGIMSLSKEGIGGGDYKGYDMGSRVGYGIIKKITRGARKAVKGAVGAVKDIASSDVGKMALLAAGAYYTGGALGGTGGFNNFATLGSVLKNKAAGMVPEFLKGKTGAALGITALGGLFGGAMAGKSEEEVEALTRDVPALKSYLTQYYTNLNPELRNQPEKVEEFVNSQIAEYNQGKGGYAMGGRIGYQDAGPVLPNDPTQPVNPFGPRPPADAPVLPNKEMASYGYDDAMSDTYNMFLQMKKNKQIPIDMDFDEFLMEVVPEMSKMQTEGRGLAAMGGRMNYGMGSDDTMSSDEYFSGKEKYMKKKQMEDMFREYQEYLYKKKYGPRDEVAMGGRMNYALGDTASQNAMQAAGVEGLPMRQNPKGVQELDLRDNGGFIPPVGIKEKEDDIPAMLSNNEFVFTADAVRGMGDGDVELGAQRMYDQMKTLEEGGRV